MAHHFLLPPSSSSFKEAPSTPLAIYDSGSVFHTLHALIISLLFLFLVLLIPTHTTMAKLLFSSLFLSLLLFSLLSVSSAACTDDTLAPGRTFQRCLDLDALDASIHWTHFPGNGTASFAFKAESDGWVAWGLNPTGSGMVGTQAFIVQHSGASGVSFFTTSLTSKRIALARGLITVSLSDFTAENRDGKLIIYVTLTLPGNGTTFNHTWQTGPLNADGTPRVHSLEKDHLKSFGTLNLVTATNAAPGTPSTTPAPGTPGSTPAGGTPSSSQGKSGAADVGMRVGLLSWFLLGVGIFMF